MHVPEILLRIRSTARRVIRVYCLSLQLRLSSAIVREHVSVQKARDQSDRTIRLDLTDFEEVGDIRMIDASPGSNILAKSLNAAFNYLPCFLKIANGARNIRHRNL